MDRVVRVLATACDRENRGVPVAHVIVVGPDTVRLHLKTPDERPPAGWTAGPDGLTWQAQLRGLQSASVAESLQEPYPRLVPLGTTREGFVLLNLGQVGGIISLEGDARRARALAEDWTRELTTSPWSRTVQVVRIGFTSGSAERFRSSETPALVDGEATLADQDGGVALLAGLPRGRDREAVYRLADDPQGRWSVVVLGRVEHPRWRFTIDSTGAVDTGLLDEPVTPRPESAWDAPAQEEAEAVPRPARSPAGASAPESPRRERRFTRRWAVVASVVVTCLVGGALALTLKGNSTPTAPVAQASDNQRASRGTTTPKPTKSAAPTGSANATGKAGKAGTLVNPATGKCLSGSAGTDGTPLVLLACDGDANQQWDVAADGTIRTKGLCMDAAWGAATAGTVVQIAVCSGNPAQQFAPKGDTVYTTHANLCVGEVNGGTGIQLLPCDQSGAEVFKRS
ncbi:ricin-type beta-trefoil lectin domain protein [Kitasatospora sp. NBC_01250]|uniref:RICIN domain-containing protein n=1 Tax=unclassified Kitasatospora TaxID=2633591 RepID=UPI002E119647|nr:MULTISPECIES: RICIN domain-containing protein [unclassified Kitasatospora]WSJ71594.1 ricin-type beta-trefoil lectin domain protein [Kitasatospora sp. NBC_01302]